MFELSPRRCVQGQGRVRGDHPLPPDQPGLHQAPGADHQVCASIWCQYNVLCKLHANVLEVRSVQRITTKFQTHDSVNVNMSSCHRIRGQAREHFCTFCLF